MEAIINLKTDEKIKKQAQKTAKELGFSLSAIINAYLRQFVRDKTLFVSSKYEQPSELMVSALNDARAEYGKGKIKKMNPKEAVGFLDKLSDK